MMCDKYYQILYIIVIVKHISWYQTWVNSRITAIQLKATQWMGVIRMRGNSMSCTEWESELNCPYAMSYTQIHTLIQQTNNSVNDPHSVSEGHSECELNCEWPQTISPSTEGWELVIIHGFHWSNLWSDWIMSHYWRFKSFRWCIITHWKQLWKKILWDL